MRDSQDLESIGFGYVKFSREESSSSKKKGGGVVRCEKRRHELTIQCWWLLHSSCTTKSYKRASYSGKVPEMYQQSLPPVTV